ncbi:MAG: CRISPR-associated endonuclease Cas2 [Bacteroidota bacterium]
MPHLICYDITKDSLRTRVSKKITEYGLDRINKSVFLGVIADERSLKELVQFLQQLLTQQGGPNDSLIIIKVSIAAILELIVLGKNELDKEELSGSKHTLIV